MTHFVAPRHRADEHQRTKEAADACKAAIADMILSGIQAGWREEELALHLADAAESYVIYLATKPRRVLKAANSNF